jgi:two-component system, sensor histidine kinase
MDIESAVKKLQKSSIFGLLSKSALTTFCKNSQFVRLPKNDVLFEEGSPGDVMYVLLQGKLEIYTRNKYIALRTPFELIGELSLISSQPRSASVKANSASILLRITKDCFDSYIAPHPKVMMEIMKILSKRSGWDLEKLDRGYKELRQFQQNYEEIVQSVSDIILRVSPEGLIVYANSSVSSLGYKAHQMIGVPLKNYVDGEGEKTILKDLLSKRISKVKGKAREVWLQVNPKSALSKKNEKLYFLISSSGIWNESKENKKAKKVQRVFGGNQLIAKDITERKKAEEELRNNKIRLEKLVKKRTKDLEKTNLELKKSKEEADSANKAKSEFLSRMSHEIRTPLNAVLGYSQILLRKSYLEPEDKDSVKGISTSGSHLLELIDEVLDMSKIEANLMEINAGDFDLNELLLSISIIFAPRCADKNLLLFVDNLKKECFVRSDQTKLRQILINLMGNAVKFTDDGFVSLKTSVLKDNLFCFEIADSGPGIPKKDHKNIFDPFRQSEEGIKKAGTGLGLAISQQHARLLGGDLIVESAVGNGAKFILTLPLPVATQKSLQRNRRDFAIKGLKGDLKIKALILDRNSNNRDVLSKLLSSIGVDAFSGADCSLALEEIKRYKPDIVFFDIKVPITDEIKTFEKISRKFKKNSLKIIAMTASVLNHEVDEFLEKGFDEVLLKPIRLENLIFLLKKCLNAEFEFEKNVAQVSNSVSGNGSKENAAKFNLPSSALEALKEAADSGNVTQLAKELAKIESMGKDGRRLKKYLEEFVKNYDLEGILSFLE